MTDNQKIERMVSVGQVFRPSAPVDKYSLFAGRKEQLKAIINAITQNGQHVIVYGERGVGKTSICNILSEIFLQLKEAAPRYVRVNCDSRDDFATLWEKIFREISITVKKRRIGFSSEEIHQELSAEAMLARDITPEYIRFMLQNIGGMTIIVIDEIDRLADKQAATLMADTIKTLSDHMLSTTLVMAGVADSVDELIFEHRSIERALVQVPMPRMSAGELLEIIDKGMTELRITIEPSARQMIANLSQGLPHYTHLLALYSTQSTIEQGHEAVTLPAVRDSISQAVDNAQQSILSAYHKATSSPQKTLYPEVLHACALTPKDELGYFPAGDIRPPLKTIMKRYYDIPSFARRLKEFCDAKRGPILQRTGLPRRYRFRFINPLMQPFIVMKGLTRGLIKEPDLQLSLPMD